MQGVLSTLLFFVKQRKTFDISFWTQQGVELRIHVCRGGTKTSGEISWNSIICWVEIEQMAIF
jgi:hypothetical protein